MKRFLCIVTVLMMLVGIMPVLSFAATQENNYMATNTGHSGNANGAGLFIGCIGTSGTYSRAAFVSGVTGNNNVTVGSARSGAIEFKIDSLVAPELITEATLKVYVTGVNGNLGNGWMKLAAFETNNPALTYTIGGMNGALFPALNDDYSYEAAFWSEEQCSKTNLGWKTIDVKRAIVNALVNNTSEERLIPVVFRVQVPAAGLNISTTDFKPTLVIKTGDRVEGVIRTVDERGRNILPEKTFSAGEGSYAYTDTIEETINKGEYVYVYNEELSVTQIELKEGNENAISLVYTRFNKEDLFSGNTIIEDGATCWFADPRSVTFEHEDIYEDGELVLEASSKTIVGAIDDSGTVKAVQYDNLTGKLVNVVIDTGFQKDDHNNPTFLYLPDHRIMVMWSEHTSEEYWYYRVTEKPDDLTTLGKEKRVSVVGFGNFTYPSPFYMTDAPDSFFLCWRGVSWHPTIAKYSLPDENGDIVCEIKPTRIVDSIGARPYVKYESNGKDRIYFTFTTAHPDNNNPNWVYYAEMDINNLNLYNVEGELLCNGTDLPYGKTDNINTTSDYGSLTVDNPSDKRDWVWDVCKNEKGEPVILFTRISGDKNQHDYYYGKWNSETKVWEKTYIADGGKWFHQNANGAEKCYSGGMSLDHSNPAVLYLSKPTEGFYGKTYEIWKLEMDGVEIKREEQITKNSKYNNVRPFVTWGSDEDDLIALTWMNGLYYYWEGEGKFPTRLMTLNALPEFNYEESLKRIELPEVVSTDIVLPQITFDGLDIEWTSTDEGVIDKNGFVTLGEKEKTVTLTAKTINDEKSFDITVTTRDVIKNNAVFMYKFEEEDLYETEEGRFIKDMSGNENDGMIFGSAKVNGVLDLTENTEAYETNGYAMAPDNILDNVRSYTVALRVKAENFNKHPRFYDFGKNSGNSLFLRAEKFSAGLKHNNTATTLVSPETVLETDKEYFICVTFDAKSGETKIYVDGSLVMTGSDNKDLVYDLGGGRNYIGRTQWWDDINVSGDNLDFCGTIDDMSLFDIALTEEELAELEKEVKLTGACRVSGDEIVVSITKENVEETKDVIVAVYSENGLLYALTTKEASVSIPKADVKTIKLFLFENEESLKPLCKYAQIVP